MTAQQTFFRRYCLLTCDTDRNDDQPYTLLRCMLPVLNMAELISAFDCTKVEEVQITRSYDVLS